jgi:hypothetical protein
MMRKPQAVRPLLTLLLLGLLAGTGYYTTGTHLTGKLREKLAEDGRNGGVETSLEGRGGDLVLDIQAVPGTFSMADMDRVLFVAATVASANAPEVTGTVTLSYQGTPRFQLPAPDFLELGREYDGGENPVYLIRVLARKVRDTQGQLVYEPVEGGWLGVAGVEMENHNDLHQRWWISSATTSSP